MEKRYELRDEIGQGGLGTVFRAYDTRMNREVAIKRIKLMTDDPSLQDESTRQLVMEAGALAALQHPNIVTIYDVGSDEQGPYVVMELISGKTLDELIQRAPLTWADFRELALQTQEALIAAHELELIHSDIKPSNLMLNWLPSGKFQTKILDFGLATLTHAQSPEALQKSESVFGSIFFMAPEQFDRTQLDCRTDLYAMGCAYYQSLTCLHPFQGNSCEAVMNSHLEHRVIPLQHLRSDIPIWVCEWIMWLINRIPSDRPNTARDALKVFLQNDKTLHPAMRSAHARATTASGPRPRPASTLLSPRLVAAPTDRENADAIFPSSVKITAPQPLVPPEGAEPSIYEAAQDPAATAPIHPHVGVHASAIGFPKNSGADRKIAITAASVVTLIIAGSLLFLRFEQYRTSQRHGLLLALAQSLDAKEIILTGREFDRFLDDAANAETEEKQNMIFRLLTIAKAADASSFDASVTEFATTSTQLLPEARRALILSVVEKRSNKLMVPSLLEFARETKDVDSAVAALNVLGPLSTDEQLADLLAVVQYHPIDEIKMAAAEALTGVIKRSNQRGAVSTKIEQALGRATDLKIRKTLARLQSACTEG